MNPYHYVENNPLRYIDPYGLDKEARQKRREKRREKRYIKKYGGNYIPEVKVTARDGSKKRRSKEPKEILRPIKAVSITGTRENEPDAIYRNADIIAEIPSVVIDALDLYLQIAELNQKMFENDFDVEQEDILESSLELIDEIMTSDNEIVKKASENSPQASPENNPVVRAYSKRDESNKPWYRKDSLITKRDAIYPDTLWTWYPNSNNSRDTSTWVKHEENAAFTLVK